MKDGSRQAEGAGQAIDAIVNGVEEGNRWWARSPARRASRYRGQEINHAIMQLEQVTQQNAAMVEEAAAKSMAFQHEADRMMATVARFKIEDGPVATAANDPPKSGRLAHNKTRLTLTPPASDSYRRSRS